MRWVIIIACLPYSSALIVISNAEFIPNNNYTMLESIINVSFPMSCICSCSNNSKCLIAMFSGIAQSCFLFLASVDQGTLKLITTDQMSSVFIFVNKTLPGAYQNENEILSFTTNKVFHLHRYFSLVPSTVISRNATVYGIWNTSASHDSYPSSPGTSTGNYFPTQGPTKLFDGFLFTKYINYGACNVTQGYSLTQCGQNTGVYLSPQQGPSLLLAFRLATPNSYPERDPLVVTIEGSNHPFSELTLGSSWTLIYNGSSGLDIDPGRKTWGVTISIQNNTIWYSSYRFLVVSKRSTGQFVQYSELDLLTY
ncbi:unnamed protein product [Adineta ricciae]|uniref:Uncharacterized protein n=1 Tax=Adineta ricciae TaxID=249248 RepID=A0A814T3R5_ADIRI|nr:unnamed protein product [Adineta ricciae]CAF1156256.1 unnamed protein product [Adineta ricciae]